MQEWSLEYYESLQLRFGRAVISADAIVGKTE